MSRRVSPATRTDEATPSSGALTRMPNRAPSKSLILGEPSGTPVVVVLGMHRSGTSLLGNILHMLGVNMADTSDTASPKNPGGFWERPAIVKLHDAMLAAMGRELGKASHNAPFPPAWWRTKEIQAIKRELSALVAAEVSESSHIWGFKDPRTARMLPIWREIFAELNLRPIYLLALRSPGESSASMADKNPALRPIEVIQGEMMWLSYNFDVMRFVGNEHLLTVNYDDWFVRPMELADEIMKHLGIDPLMDEDSLEECVIDIVSPGFRNKFEGEGAAKSQGFSQHFFNAILRGTDSADLRNYMAFLKQFFGLAAPLLTRLDRLATLEKEMPGLQEAQAKVTELNEANSKLRTDSSDLEKRGLGLEQEIATLRQQTVELHTRLEASAQRESKSAAIANDLEADLARERKDRQTLADAVHKATGDLTEFMERIATLNDKLLQERRKRSEAEDEAERRSTALTLLQAEIDKRTAELETRLQSERAEHLDKERELASTLVGLETDLTAAKAEAVRARTSEAANIAAWQSETERLAADADMRLAAARADMEAAKAEANEFRETATASIAALEADVENARTEANEAKESADARIASILAEMRAAAEHAATDAESIRTASERAKSEAERRAASLEADVTRLLDELNEARRSAQAAGELARQFYLSAHSAGPEQANISLADPATPPPMPRGSSMKTERVAAVVVKCEGAVFAPDANGISGWGFALGNPGLPLIVELRINGNIVATALCNKPTFGLNAPETAPTNSGFHIGWESLPEEARQREMAIHFAVSGEPLSGSPVRAPNDLQLPLTIARALAGGGKPAEIAFASDEKFLTDYRRWLTQHQVDIAAKGATSGEFWFSRAEQQPPVVVCVLADGRSTEAVERTLSSLFRQIGVSFAIAVLSTELLPVPNGCIAVRAQDWLEALPALPAGKLILIEAGDELAPSAISLLVMADVKAGGTDLVYSDEDCVNERGDRGDPYFKGAWSLDLALEQDFILRASLVDPTLLAPTPGTPLTIDAFYALLIAGIAHRDAPRIVHAPFQLYSRQLANRRPLDCLKHFRDLLDIGGVGTSPPPHENAPGSTGVAVNWALPEPLPKISLIVPTRDRVTLLSQCVDGLLHDTEYQNIEVIIADNESTEAETLDYLAAVGKDPRVKVLPVPGAFNFSAINNRAAEIATGSLIGLINNDLKIIEPLWLKEMAGLAMRPDVGAVGAKLLYADDTLQHAGVVTGIGLASHLYKGKPRDWPGHGNRLLHPQALSAVTAACMLMRAEVWLEVGGLDEELPVAYNDIDLCLRIRAAGYNIVWTPRAEVYHLESQSRGSDADGAKRERLVRDKQAMTERWGDAVQGDPFYSPHFSRKATDARLDLSGLTVAA